MDAHDFAPYTKAQAIIVGKDFSNRDFSNDYLVNVTYIDCDMRGVKLPTSLFDLINVYFIGCKFDLSQQYGRMYIKELYDAKYRLGKPLIDCVKYLLDDDMCTAYVTFSSGDLRQQINPSKLSLIDYNNRKHYYGYKILERPKPGSNGKIKVLATLLIDVSTPAILFRNSKCRAERAIVESIVDFNGVNYDYAHNCYCELFALKYTVGSEVVANDWDSDVMKECAGGIHFFLTEKEAWEYCL